MILSLLKKLCFKKSEKANFLMNELELLVQRVWLKKASLRVMNAITYFTWMWAVERKGKVVEQCKNKIVLLCKSQLTVNLDTFWSVPKYSLSELKSKYCSPDKMLTVYTANTNNIHLSSCISFPKITSAPSWVGIITLVNSQSRELFIFKSCF